MMKTKIITVVFVLTLTACRSAANPVFDNTDIQNTAVAILQTSAAVTQATLPILAPSPTNIASFAIPTPSMLPTVEIHIMNTPDAMQAANWREYQTALATALFPTTILQYSANEFICEWEILGSADQEIYVWMVCMSTFVVGNDGLRYNAEDPAVIHIKRNGTVQSVELPGGGSSYASDIRRMFPLYAQEMYFGRKINFKGLTDHLLWRLEHPEEPPLVVLLAPSTATPIR